MNVKPIKLRFFSPAFLTNSFLLSDYHSLSPSTLNAIHVDSALLCCLNFNLAFRKDQNASTSITPFIILNQQIVHNNLSPFCRLSNLNLVFARILTQGTIIITKLFAYLLIVLIKNKLCLMIFTVFITGLTGKFTAKSAWPSNCISIIIIRRLPDIPEWSRRNICRPGSILFGKFIEISINPRPPF